VSAYHKHPGFPGLFLATAQNLCEHLAGQAGQWPTNNIQRCLWCSSHRIDIGERVGSRDLTEGERVVDYWSEKVDRVHQSEIIAKAKNTGIIASRNTHEHIATGTEVEAREHSVQVRRT
jgi:hypothetical protein